MASILMKYPYQYFSPCKLKSGVLIFFISFLLCLQFPLFTPVSLSLSLFFLKLLSYPSSQHISTGMAHPLPCVICFLSSTQLLTCVLLITLCLLCVPFSPRMLLTSISDFLAQLHLFPLPSFSMPADYRPFLSRK